MALPEAAGAPIARRRRLAGACSAIAGFVLFIVAAGLIQSSHAVLYGFGTLHWLAAGYDKDTIGLLWAVGVVAEVMLFAAAGGVLGAAGTGLPAAGVAASPASCAGRWPRSPPICWCSC